MLLRSFGTFGGSITIGIYIKFVGYKEGLGSPDEGENSPIIVLLVIIATIGLTRMEGDVNCVKIWVGNLP